tara:strand:- start:76 stop:627 length:552 start_codon:yes stop_codon:yes gene_type:complete
MKIHSSHSKKELIEVVKSFHLYVPDFLNMSKKQLITEITNQIKYIDEIEPEKEYFFVNDKKELIDYLSSSNPTKILTIKEKQNVMLIAKKLIQYSRNGYFLAYTEYASFEEIFIDAVFIEQYGDIPSCRRALQLINCDPKLLPDYRRLEPQISKRVNKKLENMKSVKKDFGLVYSRGKFIIDF